jgi:fumarate hydratase subunit alpha
MRTINVSIVKDTIEKLFVDANFELPADVIDAIKQAKLKEHSPSGKEILDQILLNAKIASSEKLPLCQDCGVAVVFMDIGQEVSFTGGDLKDAISEGVKNAYTRNYLRSSIVTNAIERRNTNDNTPPFVHFDIIGGDKVNIFVMPKGGGCENMSYITFLNPTDGAAGIRDFVLKSVLKSGANPCPPVILGICIGGTFESSALFAKRALLRKIGSINPNPGLADLEKKILDDVNNTGIGPMGLGGTVTALAVHILEVPCHVSSLPVAINTECHSHRYKEATI